MRLLRATLAFAIAMAPAISAAQSKDFEGVIRFEVHGKSGEVMNMDFARKGDLSRMDMSRDGVSMYMIANIKARSMTMVMPKQNMYMETQLPDLPEDGSRSANVHDDMESTGRSDTVAGHSCEIWTVKDDEEKMEVCVAKDMGIFFSGMQESNDAPAWQNRFNKEGFFPLRIVDVTGESPRTVLEATKIELKQLEDSYFKPPAGARKMDMRGSGD